jgi:hypothetical protein
MAAFFPKSDSSIAKNPFELQIVFGRMTLPCDEELKAYRTRGRLTKGEIKYVKDDDPFA